MPPFALSTPPRAVLFDLDGTLLDSIPDLAEACRRMMVELGRPPHPVDTIRTFVGKGMLNLVRRPSSRYRRSCRKPIPCSGRTGARP